MTITDAQITETMDLLTQALADVKANPQSVRVNLLKAAKALCNVDLPWNQATVHCIVPDLQHQIIRALWHLSGMRCLEDQKRAMMAGHVLGAIKPAASIALALWPEGFVIRSRWLSYKDEFGNSKYEEGVGYATGKGAETTRKFKCFWTAVFETEAEAWEFARVNNLLGKDDETKREFAWVERYPNTEGVKS